MSNKNLNYSRNRENRNRQPSIIGVIFSICFLLSLSFISAEKFGYGNTVSLEEMGDTNFLDLSDTPSSYSGNANKCVSVNSGETGLEFMNCTNATITANSTEFWDTNIGTLDDVNATQFENNGQTLSIIPSWLTSFVNSIGDIYADNLIVSSSIYDSNLDRRFGFFSTYTRHYFNSTFPNVTADYYFGDGSNLQNVNYTETDPIFTSENSTLVHTFGDEDINGNKNFTGNETINGGLSVIDPTVPSANLSLERTVSDIASWSIMKFRCSSSIAGYPLCAHDQKLMIVAAPFNEQASILMVPSGIVDGSNPILETINADLDDGLITFGSSTSSFTTWFPYPVWLKDATRLYFGDSEDAFINFDGSDTNIRSTTGNIDINAKDSSAGNGMVILNGANGVVLPTLSADPSNPINGTTWLTYTSPTNLTLNSYNDVTGKVSVTLT